MPCLPKDGLWYSVQTEKSVFRRGPLGRMLCKHPQSSRIPHLYVDRRSGPGWMSDTYEGVTCCECGEMIKNVRTY